MSCLLPARPQSGFSPSPRRSRTAPPPPPAERRAGEGKTAAYTAVDGRLAGLVALADTLKPSARPAVETLRKSGLRVVMLTGDNARTARSVCGQGGMGGRVGAG